MIYFDSNGKRSKIYEGYSNLAVLPLQKNFSFEKGIDSFVDFIEDFIITINYTI